MTELPPRAMIDLHCHLLPGVDDGAAGMAEALGMAALAVEDGVLAICATPHMFDGRYRVTPARAAAAAADLRGALTGAGIPLELHLGGECRLGDELLEAARAGRAPTLGGGPTLLVELPPGVFPPALEQQLFELRVHGYRPLLAHAERYGAFQSRNGLARLRRLVEQEVLVQVTAGALLGVWGPEAEDCARAIVEGGLCHVIASDAHTERGRPPTLSAARAVVEGLVGPEAAARLVFGNPARLLKGGEVFQPAPPPKRRGLLRRLLRLS